MGQSETELIRAFEPYAVWVRVCVVSLSGIFAVFTVPSEFTIRMSLLVLLVLWWCAIRVYWMYHPTAQYRLLACEALVVPTLTLSQGWSGTVTVDSWALAVASSTALTYQFEWATRPVLAMLLAALSMSSYAGGLALAASPQERAIAITLAARVLAECVLWRGFYLATRRKARTADRMLERAAAHQRAALVNTSRRDAEREHLATLHDTASATLLAASCGAPGYSREALAERARRDLAALTALQERGGSQVHLSSSLSTVARQHLVRLQSDIRGALSMPASAGLAILGGVQEALVNIERHAGTDEASLHAHSNCDGQVVVALTDSGTGFDPAQVPEQRRGISASILGRMRAVGGAATVTSRPGGGTTVEWVWPDECG